MSASPPSTEQTGPALKQEQIQNILFQPYRYCIKNPGKLIREQLAVAINHWLKINEQVLDEIKDIAQLLHNASLMIDDIEDNSTLRRTLPCCHLVYGVPTTINSGTYLMFVAAQRIIELQKKFPLPKDNRPLVETGIEHILLLHEGQGLDIYWRDHATTAPTVAEYEEMVYRKTGGLFRLVVKLMQAYSPCPVQLDRLIYLMSVYFQVRDDFANLVSTEYTETKGFADDITEGKMSYPVVYALSVLSSSSESAEDVSRDVLWNILRTRTDNFQLKCLFIKQLKVNDGICCHVWRKRGQQFFLNDSSETISEKLIKKQLCPDCSALRHTADYLSQLKTDIENELVSIEEQVSKWNGTTTNEGSANVDDDGNRGSTGFRLILEKLAALHQEYCP